MISIVCVNNRFISCVIVLLYSAIPLIWPSHVTKLTLFLSQEFLRIIQIETNGTKTTNSYWKTTEQPFCGSSRPVGSLSDR